MAAARAAGAPGGPRLAGAVPACGLVPPSRPASSLTQPGTAPRAAGPGLAAAPDSQSTLALAAVPPACAAPAGLALAALA
ncbi:MAG: hypothetical protein ACLP70_24380, partial [Streptosporangiaceae bacterium]